MAGLQTNTPTPEDITAHSASRVLEVKFSDGATFRIPFELMRVHSPSAEVKGHGPGQEVLQTGKRNPAQQIADPGFFQFGNHRFRDDKEGGHGMVDMYKSVVQSCDTYYYLLARDMGVDLIHDQMKPFGFGQLTGIDILGESRGILPSTEWKRTTYRKPEQQRWYSGETISLGIGQGYNSFTMLQLAHATATLVNNGLKMKPHLVREVMDVRPKARPRWPKSPLVNCR